MFERRKSNGHPSMYECIYAHATILQYYSEQTDTDGIDWKKGREMEMSRTAAAERALRVCVLCRHFFFLFFFFSPFEGGN